MTGTESRLFEENGELFGKTAGVATLTDVFQFQWTSNESLEDKWTKWVKLTRQTRQDGWTRPNNEVLSCEDADSREREAVLFFFKSRTLRKTQKISKHTKASSVQTSTKPNFPALTWYLIGMCVVMFWHALFCCLSFLSNVYFDKKQASLWGVRLHNL